MRTRATDKELIDYLIEHRITERELAALSAAVAEAGGGDAEALTVLLDWTDEQDTDELRWRASPGGYDFVNQPICPADLGNYDWDAHHRARTASRHPDQLVYDPWRFRCGQ